LYFIWDADVTLPEFQARLADPIQRPYWLATLLRQAKPDDVYRFVTLPEIDAAWPVVRAGVGKQAAFWEWRLARWRARGE
jgi:hypothetical protein